MHTSLVPPPATPDPAALRLQFTSLAGDLHRSDVTLQDMVAKGSAAADGWGPHLGGLADRLLVARDGLRALHPDAGELAGKLALDVRAVATAGGALTMIARQGSKLAAGWGTVLDGAVADAHAAVDLLGGAPVPAPAPVPGPAPTPGAGALLDAATRRDVEAAVGLIGRSAAAIRAVPASDAGSDGTKDARIGAFRLNKDAQALLEPYFASGSGHVVSELRRADASLEDAAWQLAKKPSPDGRFNGVDVPGALRDTQAAGDALTALLGAG